MEFDHVQTLETVDESLRGRRVNLNYGKAFSGLRSGAANNSITISLIDVQLSKLVVSHGLVFYSQLNINYEKNDKN